ncbi:putative tricarboxylic transport membrane protein [Saccharopolyspora antimicrobica]|uniref:Tricarboxylic transport membrane protein n=1 Tax=Saccharopolyspora antimicrobica TaxID=455193 RepID=A0A1I5L423_9PSEU|nr:tripartite tricarboxylate transporter TctB family protein [Saccharopolyspora antimicrobica]RKT86902.1 putative tricarboxylic transport membrane protein [Saccharopolyspora antimicrobica]SFO92070.1 putative tricarboxylic transport membrane protein [Saccharopolyspora antimicrobica]
MSDAEPEHRRPAGMAANVVVALAVVVVGICGAVGSWSLGLGSAAEPAAGTWPFLVSVVLAVLGVVLGLLARRTNDAERMSPASWTVLAGIATMAGFAAAITVIGFEIPAALLAFAWLRFLGRESWSMSVFGGLGIVVAFYVVFVGLLKVPVPHLF